MRGPVIGSDQLSAVFAALADPTRRAILAELADGDATVTELTAPLPISMPAVSRHLKVLERAALISRTRSGKWRASRLEAAPLRDAADWIERYQRFWDASFTRLDAHLAAVQAAERARERMAHQNKADENKVPDEKEL
jgi:DNA-binding transcriptional ArsR family regulator